MTLNVSNINVVMTCKKSVATLRQHKGPHKDLVTVTKCVKFRTIIADFRTISRQLGALLLWSNDLDREHTVYKLRVHTSANDHRVLVFPLCIICEL